MRLNIISLLSLTIFCIIILKLIQIVNSLRFDGSLNVDLGGDVSENQQDTHMNEK